jgi:hypothetical protein
MLGLALADCGVNAAADPHAQRERAAAMVAFTAIARLQVSGRVGERWVVDKVVQIAEPYFDGAIVSLPLGRLYVLDDEWGAGWGRTDEQLRAVVRQACTAQLKASRS